MRVPPEPLWYVFPIADFHAKLEEARDLLPLEWSSWYRDPDSNADADGLRFSQHLAGLAKDAVGPVEDLEVLARRCRDLGFVAVMEPGHLHIQRFPKGFLSWCMGLPGEVDNG